MPTALEGARKSTPPAELVSRRDSEALLGLIAAWLDEAKAVLEATREKKIAEELIKDLNSQKIWDRPIVTEVAKLDKFYMAEDYHQEYFARNPYQPYCQAVVAPKVSKFRKHFLDMLKKQPV